MKLTDQYRDDHARGRKPSSPMARAMFAALDWLDGRKVNGVEGLDLRGLRRRAHSAMVRLEAGRPVADGRPRGADMNGGGRSKGGLTSVEAAAERLAFGRDPEDPVHALARRVATEISRAAQALQSAQLACDALDAMAVDIPIDSPSCDLCREAGLANPRTWEKYGDCAGRLPTPLHLCGPHYMFCVRHGKAPTVEMTQWHDEHGTWRLKAA